jgi:hypothetical protein
MPADTLIVPRAVFSFEEPWQIPSACEPVSLVRSTDGREPRLQTTFAMYADEDYLNAIFVADDDEVVATHLLHDAPLYQEDVVELFLAPSAITRYFEIEVNPLGTVFDAAIDSPDGVRTSMKADLAWKCEGLFAALRRMNGRVETVLRAPFASFGVEPPQPGAIWRGNAYRIDRSKSAGDEYSAWRPTMRNPPDFHVAAAFGRMEFR